MLTSPVFVPAHAQQLHSSQAIGYPPLGRSAQPSRSVQKQRTVAEAWGFGSLSGSALLGWACSGRRRHDGRRDKSRCRSVQVVAQSDTSSGVASIGVLLLSAGVGKRMGAGIPKQYIKLLGLEIALHSLECFLECGEVSEIAIVCAEEWRHVFSEYLRTRGDVKPTIKYAVGGAERQDSVCNGLAQLTTDFAAVHDAARPLVTQQEIESVIKDAHKYGTALLAVQTKATIKQSLSVDGEILVHNTPNRKTMWEALTPQVVSCELLRQGFKHADENGLAVTDDVSLVELLGKPVKLTEGEYTNIKVTTPEDIAVAEAILRGRGFVCPESA